MPRRFRIAKVALCTFACAVGVTLSCGGGALAQTSSSGLESIRVAFTPNDSATAVLFALRTGRFRQAGLDVQIEPTNNGAAGAAGVAGGSFEIALASITSIVSAHQRGVPFVLIAPGDLYDTKAPSQLLVVASDSAIHSAKDLSGSTLSCASLSGIDCLAVHAWVDQHGGDSKQLKFIELPQSAAATALEEHRVSAAQLSQPMLSMALASGKVRVLAPAEDAIGPSFIVNAWFTTSSWAAQHRHTVAQFARIIEESADYANAHHSETVSLMAEYLKIPADVFAHMTRVTLGNRMNPTMLQPVIDLSAKYGLLTRPFPAQEVMFDPLSR